MPADQVHHEVADLKLKAENSVYERLIVHDCRDIRASLGVAKAVMRQFHTDLTALQGQLKALEQSPNPDPVAIAAKKAAITAKSASIVSQEGNLQEIGLALRVKTSESLMYANETF